MTPFLQQVFSLLTTNPGNLTYHLVLAFTIAGTLPAALLQGRNRRLAIGLGILLGLRVALFMLSAAAWQGLIQPLALPPADRAATLLGIVIIIWLWAFPERQRLADAATGIITLLVGAVSLLGIVWWAAHGAGQTFNGSWPDFLAEILALVLTGIGIVVLLVRQPEGWGLGAAMLIVLGLGHAGHLAFPLPGSDWPGAVRLAQMAAFPLLLALPYRAPLAGLTGEGRLPPSAVPAARLQNLLSLTPKTSAEDIYPDISPAITRLFNADVCLLLSLRCAPATYRLTSGWDLRRAEALSISQDLTLEKARPGTGPDIFAALLDGRTVRLNPLEANAQLFHLSQGLGFLQPGAALASPIPATDDYLALLLLSPHNERSWTSAEESLLASASAYISRLIAISQISVEPGPGGAQPVSPADKKALAKLESELRKASERVEELERNYASAMEQAQAAHNQADAERARAESLAELLKNQELKLAQEPHRLPQEMKGTPQASPSETEASLALALEEIARLRETLAEKSQPASRATLPEPAADGEEEPGDIYISGDQAEVIASISQELRQPMSSIIGYTDLLLGESVGILGALQRKFLERVKASTERMGALVDDLIQITSTENGKLKLSPEKVDVNAVIDESIAMTIGQFREKNIVLRVDIPEGLPRITADRDSLQQVLIHLLQNAGGASGIEGEITLRACIKDDDHGQEDYFLIQVSDTGGGIPPEDMPRVFSRLYRADNPLIQGVGDTGVGLSIVKTLVEAHGGRIWVDTEAGRGSTFSVVLPMGGGESAEENG